MGSGAFLVQVCRWLSERLVETWALAEDEGKSVTSEGEVVDAIGSREPLRKDTEERLLTAARLIAERCLYGVDMNPLAVELAKLSIWLVTLAKGRPFGFLDHNLRCGDSLLGVTILEQLTYLDMSPGKGSTKKLFASKIDQAVSQAIELRSELRRFPIRDIRDVEAMARLDEEARRKLEIPELVADLLIGEVLDAGGREVDTAALAIDVGGVLAGDEAKYEKVSQRAQKGLKKDLHVGSEARRPFHWPLEFPEVFNAGRVGFDAFVGNPPFVGGQLLSGNFGLSYQSYLVNFVTYDEKASVDLVVFFFLRVYGMLREGACMGLLARRSISEGKNREAGLTQLLARGANIYCANTNIKWPGKASVVVHQIHIFKGDWIGERRLNKVGVATISADLSGSEFWEAQKLDENLARIFQGTILLGEGFKVSATTASAWISGDEKYNQILFPFIGGNEVNKDPRYTPSCWVINFWDWQEQQSKNFPLAYEQVKREVLPDRLKQKNEAAKIRWWIHYKFGFDLYHKIGHGQLYNNHPVDSDMAARPLQRVMVISTGVTKYPAFTFLPSSYVFSNKLCVLADERYCIFAVLSSDVHGVWAWAQKTSLGGDLHSLVYAHGNIFETFPFPSELLEGGDDKLEDLGRRFFHARQSFMETSEKGLTKFYNDFHNPAKNDDALKELRRLQEEINKAVCRQYGWCDLDLACGSHEVGYLPEGKNTRFTITEEARLEVLRRLSKSNKTRFEEQERSGSTTNSASASDPSITDAAFQDGLFAIRGGKA